MLRRLSTRSCIEVKVKIKRPGFGWGVLLSAGNDSLHRRRTSNGRGIAMQTRTLEEVSQPVADREPTVVAARSAEQVEEQRLLRRLQMMMNMVMQVIAQDSSLSVDDASQMIADARIAALTMFPGKELAYDLIWKPRFQRLMRERFRLV
jgi:hypothetical protein